MRNENKNNRDIQPQYIQDHPDIHASVVSLELIWQALDQGDGRQALKVFQHDIRELTAAAMAAGYPKVADLTSIIDLMLAPVIAREEKFTAELRSIVHDYLAAARELSLREPVVRAEPAGHRVAEKGAYPEVLLLQPDQQLAKELHRQISHFGYVVRIVDDYESLLGAVAKSKPYGIIIDDELVATGALTSEHAAELRQHIGQRLPLIFLGKHGDVESRLAAARAGADVYLVKPVDFHELVDQLDRIDTDDAPEPYHIIVVEDSATQATYNSAILKKAGMIATVVSDPMRVLDVMCENTADLVLMDMYMPGCNGMELAKVIRQVPRHASIPIVYLSAEMELNRQLDALSLGGDDFLTKPINPMHLIRSISIRAERARSLRTLMVTDNLTGLLNHSRIKEQLQTEVARAQRTGSVLSFAMLDIDCFKSINDTHGHHVGDRVIKTMARVLQQRLRQTDSIGRHGGEEFAVILPDAGIEKATMILDQLRADFSKVYQLAPGGAFNVTFSGGVATLADTGDAVSLAVAADKALYTAKREGRNRIARYCA
jgi:diguanylate cyclase (GGDEF)-like protein